MIYLVVVLVAALVAFGYLLYRQGENHRRDVYDREEAWRGERADLLAAIQTGATVQRRSQKVEPIEPRDADEYRKVGTISLAPDGDGDSA